MKLKFALLGLSIFAIQSLKAQGDIDQLIKGSKEDANYLVSGYVTPAFNVIGNGLNQSWYNTAQSHKTLGFDLTITMSGIFLPSSDLSYKVENSKMNSLKNYPYPGGPASIDAPTIFGKDFTPQYQPVTNGVPIGSTISGAPGTGVGDKLSFVPIPMVQLGIGLPKGTDLKLRFFPNTNIGDNGNASMFGFGIMHDVKQYLPGVKSLPFDLSAFFGYTKLKIDVGLDDANPDQHAIFNTSAMTIQGLISKKISVLTVYGGAGYNFVSNDFNVKGTYYLGNGNVGTTVTDPISMSNSQSGPRLTAGFRLKFAIFTLHGDYTLQKYSAFTAGFGFSVR